MNCFNPLRSDLDLLVVTKREMTIETTRQIAEFLLENRTASPFEISFLRQTDLSTWCYPTTFDFHSGENWREKFERALASGAWRKGLGPPPFDERLAAHITVTNHRGLCLFGTAISDVFPGGSQKRFYSLDPRHRSAKFGFEAILQYPVYVAAGDLAVYRQRIEGGVWAYSIALNCSVR